MLAVLKSLSMATNDEAMIHQLINALIEAWNRGDAQAYGAHYLDEATFTNVNGMFHVSRDEFDRRHDEIFRGGSEGKYDYTDTKENSLRPSRCCHSGS